MGNSGGSEQKSDEEYNQYVGNMQLIRKEHSDNFGKDIDIYRPNSSKFEEERIMVLELAFDEEQNTDSKTSEDIFK
jgi:hypothetical protein